jgi:hypothetical protein
MRYIFLSTRIDFERSISYIRAVSGARAILPEETAQFVPASMSRRKGSVPIIHFP